MKAELTNKAKKQLARLPRNEQKKVVSKLRVIEAYPFSGKALSGEYAGQYSFRAWPNRIIYLIDKKQKRAVIINIEHRQGAYK